MRCLVDGEPIFNWLQEYVQTGDQGGPKIGVWSPDLGIRVLQNSWG